MSSFDQYQTPFENPSAVFFHRRHILRRLRNGLIIGIGLLLLVKLAGEPYLRWEYRYRGSYSNPSIISATYFGFSGRLEVQANEYAEGCPIVLFVKPKAPF